MAKKKEIASKRVRVYPSTHKVLVRMAKKEQTTIAAVVNMLANV